jgi:hypothetical protein
LATLFNVFDLDTYADVQAALVVCDADFGFIRLNPAFDLVEQRRSNPFPCLGVEPARELARMHQEKPVRRVELLELLDAHFEAVVQRQIEVLDP